MPLQATSGTASYDAFGGGAAVEPVYIEQIFQTYLYTGNGSTQTITNGIDLSTKGGLVWIKSRNTAESNVLYDTVRGVNQQLQSNNADASSNSSNTLTAFNSDGFTLGTNRTDPSVNYASWTLRRQPKFFDVVTYTGDSVSGREISHNLGSTPGCIIVKCTTNVTAWRVYHRSLVSTGTGVSAYLRLDSTAAVDQQTRCWGFTGQPTATTFGVGNDGDLNETGQTYVAYIFAHDAGGFGLTGTDNVISCGSCSSDASGYIQPVNLGYEPQWVMLKRTNSSANWVMMDTMRGMANTAAAASPILLANTSAAEAATGVQVNPTATGFEDTLWGGWGASNTYIYIAIRRGPMKVPTTGTSVFDISTVSTSSGPVPGPTPTDMTLNKPSYNISTNNWRANDRLRGGGLSLFPNTTGSESSENYVYFDYQSGLRLNSWPVSAAIWYNFKRAPSFFDEVCYLGNGSTQTITHNLGVAPELIIIKSRNNAYSWSVGSKFTGSNFVYNTLESTDAGATFTYSAGVVFNDQPSASSVFLNSSGGTNQSGATFVMYLFATCAGVSKVGSYTGTATTKQIDCGFTGGARFVLIKKTSGTGSWYVWDSARGIVSGNDPYLLLNSTAAEVTNTDYIDAYSAGFEISSTAPAEINASGGTFIFLAIA